MNWITPVIAVILACYGWWLIVQHAKHREASELYASIISVLEQLANEGKNAWEKDPEKLDQHTELKFLLLLEAIEQRLSILKTRYSKLSNSIQPVQEQIWLLRHYLTAVPLKIGKGLSRGNGILQLTHTMTSTLLDENYHYFGKGRRYSAGIGGFVLILCILIAVFGTYIDCFIDFLPKLLDFRCPTEDLCSGSVGELSIN